MKQTKQPYELLVRWNTQGQVSGAHVQYSTVITDDNGAVVADTPGDAEPLALGSFPLTDVLNDTQASVLADNTRLRAEADAARQAHEAAMAALNDARGQEAAALRTELATTKDALDLANRANEALNTSLSDSNDKLTKAIDATKAAEDAIAVANAQAEQQRVSYETRITELEAALNAPPAPTPTPTEEERIQAAVDKQLAAVRFNAEVDRRVQAALAS